MNNINRTNVNSDYCFYIPSISEIWNNHTKSYHERLEEILISRLQSFKTILRVKLALRRIFNTKNLLWTFFMELLQIPRNHGMRRCIQKNTRSVWHWTCIRELRERWKRYFYFVSIYLTIKSPENPGKEFNVIKQEKIKILKWFYK